MIVPLVQPVLYGGATHEEVHVERLGLVLPAQNGEKEPTGNFVQLVRVFFGEHAYTSTEPIHIGDRADISDICACVVEAIVNEIRAQEEQEEHEE